MIQNQRDNHKPIVVHLTHTCGKICGNVELRQRSGENSLETRKHKNIEKKLIYVLTGFHNSQPNLNIYKSESSIFLLEVFHKTEITTHLAHFREVVLHLDYFSLLSPEIQIKETIINLVKRPTKSSISFISKIKKNHHNKRN